MDLWNKLSKLRILNVLRSAKDSRKWSSLNQWIHSCFRGVLGKILEREIMHWENNWDERIKMREGWLEISSLGERVKSEILKVECLSVFLISFSFLIIIVFLSLCCVFARFSANFIKKKQNKSIQRNNYLIKRRC